MGNRMDGARLDQLLGQTGHSHGRGAGGHSYSSATVDDAHSADSAATRRHSGRHTTRDIDTSAHTHTRPNSAGRNRGRGRGAVPGLPPPLPRTVDGERCAAQTG